MKRRLLISVALLLLIVAAAAVAAQRSRGDAKDRGELADKAQWEYLVVAGGNVNLSTAGNEQYPNMRKQPDTSFHEYFPLARNLDKLGAKGWELVAVAGPPNNPVFYFKRPMESSR
jgi:hypothetical protein